MGGRRGGKQPWSSPGVAHVLQQVGLPLPDPALSVTVTQGVEALLSSWLQRWKLLGLSEITADRPSSLVTSHCLLCLLGNLTERRPVVHPGPARLTPEAPPPLESAGFDKEEGKSGRRLRRIWNQGFGRMAHLFPHSLTHSLIYCVTIYEALGILLFYQVLNPDRHWR